MAVLLDTERDVSFDFGPQSRPRPSRLWWLASVFLLLALAAQGGYRYRARSRYSFPKQSLSSSASAPSSGATCRYPRRAELLSMSPFRPASRRHPSQRDVLTATLRNAPVSSKRSPLGAKPHQYPGQTVARRILTPKDYVPQSTRSEPGFAAGSELQIRVYIEAAAPNPTAIGSNCCTCRNAMRTLICGSIAYDKIMVFRGRFRGAHPSEQIHILNVAFLVPEAAARVRGCAGNIAYNLKLRVLIRWSWYGGDDSCLYFERLERLGIKMDFVRQVPNTLTLRHSLQPTSTTIRSPPFIPGR